MQGFADNRARDVMILRPIREFPSTEIATYATLNQLNTVSLPSLTDKVIGQFKRYSDRST